MERQQAAVHIASSKRILVLGSAGTGKTTFSIRLGGILQRKVIHLDAEFWQPGWVPTPQPQWRQKVASLVEQESWIMDGTYERSLDLRIPFADSIVLIEHSRWKCLWRAIKRRATIDDQSRPDAPPGQTLEPAFLRYIWQYPNVTRPYIHECVRQYGEGKPLIQLVGSDQIQRFLAQVEEQAEQKTRSRGGS